MSGFDDREQYQSDQRVPAKGLPILFVGTLGGSVLIAWLLKLLFVHGWYLLFLVPAFAGLLLGALLHFLVGWTRCRNAWLAGGLGLVAGIIAYLGYYHFCLLDFIPAGNAHRLDLLPRFIAFRIQTDVAEDIARPKDAQAKKSFPLLNWMGFLFEMGMIAGVPATIAATRARRAYCPELQQWMEQETALLAPFSSEPLLQALQRGQLEEFVARNRPGGDPRAACRLILEYVVPTDDTPLSYPIYATIKDQSPEKSMLRPGRWPRTYLRQAVLTMAEVLSLRPLFPKLAHYLEIQHAQLRADAADLPAASGGDAAPAVDIATIAPVPDPYRQRVRGPGYALKVNLIGLAPLLFILAGGGLVYLGYRLASTNQIPISLGPFALGGLGIAWGIYTGLYCMSVYESRWINRRLRAELTQRPDVLLDPADPANVYVSLIPRESFAQVKLTMSSDLLLMSVDTKRRAVLLEGDNDRYRIPAGAVETCEPQCFFHPMDANRQNELWMVRLVVRTRDGTRELLLSVNQTGFRPRTNKTRLAVTEATCRQINALGMMH
jgi:hypothetical protein